MNIKAFAVPLLMSVGASLIAISGYSSAHAYTVELNGRTAGNPSGQALRDISVDSKSDIGRTLDPIWLSLSAGTSTDDGSSTLTQDIWGNVVLKVLNLTADKLSLDFKVNNTTDPNYQAAIVSMWFGLSPDATSATIQDGETFDRTRVNPNGNAPGGFKKIDVCLFAANNCSGGNINKGLQAGEEDSFIVDIFGDFGVYDNSGIYTHSEVTISDFGAKWQTQDGSFEVAGVPEPMTILGSGAALGFGVLMKRRNASQEGKKKKKAIA